MKAKILLITAFALVGCKCDFPDPPPSYGISSNSKTEVFKETKSEYPGVNVKIKLNDGSISPGLDISPNVRMNLSTGDLELGTNVGGMWMSF